MAKKKSDQEFKLVTEDAAGVPVTQLATRVPRDLYRELKLYAVTANVSISALITEAVADLLKKKNWKFSKPNGKTKNAA